MHIITEQNTTSTGAERMINLCHFVCGVALGAFGVAVVLAVAKEIF